MTELEITNKSARSVIPSSRRTHLSDALKEVELIEKGMLPKKSAQTFLNEMRLKKRMDACTY